MTTRTQQAAHQAVFNHFVTALRQQGEPAIDEHYDCVYFDKASGNRCGIGHLIAPVYSPKLEGQTWNGLCELKDRDPILHPGKAAQIEAARAAIAHVEATYGPVDQGFMEDMQSIHDESHHNQAFNGGFLVAFENRIAAFAQAHNLTIPEAA